MSHDDYSSFNEIKQEDVNPGCKSISVGYRGQKYQIEYVDSTGIWKVFGWQNEQTGGLLKSVSLWPEAKRYRIIEVDPAVWAVFHRS
jgi:hypothetical protein